MHSSILAWRLLWTEEPGMLQSMGSERAGHKRAHTNYAISLFIKNRGILSTSCCEG